MRLLRLVRYRLSFELYGEPISRLGEGMPQYVTEAALQAWHEHPEGYGYCSEQHILL